MMATCVAAPAVPVAEKVTGEPVRPAFVTVSVLAPAVVPSVQEPTVAMPLLFVVAVAVVTLPPPLATTNVTLVPEIGLLFTSRTITLGKRLTAVPTVALWLLPPLMAICVATPPVPVAVKVTGVTPETVAVSVFEPAVPPSVQLEAVAIPLLLVVALPPETLPPPLATENVTLALETTLLFASRTITLGAMLTAVPTAAV